MKITFAKIRCAIDILRGRLPGALAMLKAESVSISTGSRTDLKTNPPHTYHWCEIHFSFDRDPGACGNAYRAMERLYEMDRVQREFPSLRREHGRS